MNENLNLSVTGRLEIEDAPRFYLDKSEAWEENDAWYDMICADACEVIFKGKPEGLYRLTLRHAAWQGEGVPIHLVWEGRSVRCKQIGDKSMRLVNGTLICSLKRLAIKHLPPVDAWYKVQVRSKFSKVKQSQDAMA